MEIGLDVGYGMTKAISSDGQVKTFRSIVGIGTPDMLGIAHRNALAVQINNDRYTIGEDAEKYKLPLINVRKRNSIESIAYKALILAAIGDIPEELNIVTGLPLDFYSTDKERISRVFTGLFPGSQITIIPQPAGSFFDMLLNSDGNIANDEYAKKKIGIIDIGTYTTDLLLLEKADPIKELSSTITIGIDTLIRNIVKDCAHIRRNLPQKDIENALKTGTLSKHGQQIDISDTVSRNRAAVARNIWSYVNSVWGAEDDIEELILTGGGATVFRDAFVQSNITSPSAPFMSNVYGFYKLARRIGHGSKVQA